MTTTLTDVCGPHCVTKDGHTSHCPMCHKLMQEHASRMIEHEGLNREREQWARDDVNVNPSG